jgi:glycosyltransferase involved in cell wall biosynthesis
MKPLVSIICLTYNHKDYIRKCLDGFVSQKTTFSFEIIVHDDASTDNTQEILREYDLKYPSLFNNTYQTVNQFKNKEINIWIDFVFPLLVGKYVAFCEGDDFWTDPNKLQKQVNFLENNDEFVLCYHETNILSNGLIEEDFAKQKNISQISGYYDLLCFGNYMQTSSVVFLNKLNLFPFEKSIQLNDYVLWFWLSRFGKIYRINEIMSVYRLGPGIWSSLSKENKLLHTLNALIEAKKIVKNENDHIVIDQRINSITLSLLPPELQKINKNHYNLNEYLYRNVNIETLIFSIFHKFIRNIFRLK